MARRIALPFALMWGAVSALAAETRDLATQPETRGTRPAMSLETEYVLPPLIDPQCDATLRRMAEYLSSLKSFSIVAEAVYDEVPEPGVQKLQFSRSIRIDVHRPDRLRSLVEGDAVHRAVWYDGKELDVLDIGKNVYCRIKAKPTMDATIEELHTRYGLAVPLADLLFSDVYAGMKKQMRTGRYVGLHHVGRNSCHHLAFTQQNVDWQIWIDAGDHPLPRKFVIAYKNEPEWPQYCVILHEWNMSPEYPEGHFQFEPPAGAIEADIEQQITRGRR